MVLKWCKEGKTDSGYVLNKSHKNQILKIVFRSKDFSLVEKNSLFTLVHGDDTSDLAQNIRLTCMASLPDAGVKEEVWLELVAPQSKFSLYQRKAKMQGFFHSD
jgi:hypothetical protein